MEIYFARKSITRLFIQRVIDFFKFVLLACVLANMLLFVGGCTGAEQPKLNFSFQLNDKDGFIPSNQMAIWLQKPGNEYIKTFFVSDYLAYGSHTDDICLTWMDKLQRKNLSGDMIDAVSQATPDVGDVTLGFEFPVDELDTGMYEYCIEIHVTQKYNEIYCGKIEITGKGNNPIIGDANVAYLPGKCPKGSELLSNIKVTYVKE